MKKILIFLAALLLMLCGCSEEEIPLNEKKPETEAIQVPDENLPAKMEVSAVSDSEITVLIENISGTEVVFSEDFSLQFRENGKWYILPAIRKNYGFNEIALLLAPGEKREWSTDFAWIYGRLPEGEYRIIKHISTEEAGEYKSFRIGAEFLIKPESEEKIPFENTFDPEKSVIPEKSFVLRSNSPSGESDYLLWYHAENEKKTKSDRPVIVIENMDELISLLMDTEGIYFWGDMENSADKQLKKYGGEFFENNVLIISHIRASSGSVRYSVSGIDISGGKFTVRVSAEIPEVGTADIADWFIIIEQPKDSVEGISEYEMRISVKK
ncbi:MAG: hypothetical protein IJA17_06920 [Oscillospiraceae bacterium]|nr:hypothetical protein [Oscillospiraceae bacterium]